MPCAEENSQVGTTHEAVIIKVGEAGPVTGSPRAQHEAKVRTVDVTVKGQVAEAITDGVATEVNIRATHIRQWDVATHLRGSERASG
jgi:hypothetical protein